MFVYGCMQEVLVLYRRKSSPGWLKRVKEKVFGEEEGPRLMRREPIMLRVLRDIPVPSWKLVLPDKLLQFRPLDGLRADLVTVAGERPAVAPHACTECCRASCCSACWPSSGLQAESFTAAGKQPLASQSQMEALAQQPSARPSLLASLVAEAADWCGIMHAIMRTTIGKPR